MWDPHGGSTDPCVQVTAYDQRAPGRNSREAQTGAWGATRPMRAARPPGQGFFHSLLLGCAAIRQPRPGGPSRVGRIRLSPERSASSALECSCGAEEPASEFPPHVAGGWGQTAAACPCFLTLVLGPNCSAPSLLCDTAGLIACLPAPQCVQLGKWSWAHRLLSSTRPDVNTSACSGLCHQSTQSGIR